MARLVRLACFSSIAAVLGCSALVDTDPGRLGGEVPGADAGPEVDADGVDGGPGLDGGDGGPVLDGGSADTGPRPDASTPDCPAPPTCDGDVRIFCDRSGTLQREACEGGCAGGACVAPRPWRPSNVDASHWAADAGDLDLREGGIFDTTTCRATSARTAIVESGGQSLCVVSFGSLRVREGVRLRVVGTRAAVFMVDGEARIEGTLDASAEGIRPGPGGFRGGVQNQVDGGGPGAGEAGANSSFDDGGGGGGGACGEGGDGGDGGAASGGAGGAAVLAGRTLEPLIGGSGGGRGRGAFYTGGTNAGLGGAGGGAIQISARGRLVVTGQILAGGGGGLPGSRGGTGSTNWGSGGGGGAGGSILLEAADLEVTGRLLAAGGGGGGGAGSGGAGGAGADGVTAAPRAAGGAGSALPGDLGGAGGAGGGGEVLDGEGGADVVRPNGNGGGGGGGAGCVIVRTDGAAGAIDVNPSVAPGYRALPLLR